MHPSACLQTNSCLHELPTPDAVSICMQGAEKMLPGPYCTFYQQSHIQPHVHLQGRPSRDVYVAPRLGWGAAPGGLPCQGRSCAGVQPGQCLAQAWLRSYSDPVRGAMQLRHQDGLPPATGWPATGQQLSGPPCCASCCRQQHLLAFWEQHVAV